jgi:hypothetical protein
MPRYAHFLIIIAVAAKLDLSVNVLVVFPVGYARHISWDNYFSKVIYIVQTFRSLFGKVFIAFVNQELM